MRRLSETSRMIQNYVAKKYLSQYKSLNLNFDDFAEYQMLSESRLRIICRCSIFLVKIFSR